MANLGYHGSIENKNNIIARMARHIEQDDLILGVYLDMRREDFDQPFHFVGCAVACIAEEDLKSSKYGQKAEKGKYVQGMFKHLYKETNKLLNIPHIASFIDEMHESYRLKAQALKQAQEFNMTLLNLIEIDIDYRSFIKYVVTSSLDPTISRYYSTVPNVYRMLTTGSEKMRDFIRRIQITPEDFLELLKKYNEMKKKGIKK